jgi:hypothetical protein
MKTRATVLIVAAMLLVSWGTALGQMPMQFGLRAGVSVAKLKLDPKFVDLDSRTGFAGGGFVLFDMPGIWGIQVEALYVQKGGSTEVQVVDLGGTTIGTATGSFEVDYFEIPVLAKIGLGQGPVHILAGPAIAFKTTSKLKAKDLPANAEDFSEELDFISSTDFGLVLGLGASLPTGFGAVVFDGRYTLGLKNINDEDGASFKNGAFLVSAGVTF